jgi:capsular polysaccharide biosynthesis protein
LTVRAGADSTLLRRVRARLFRDEFIAEASRTWVLSPESLEPSPGVTHFSDELTRISGVHADDSFESALEKLHPGQRRHVATVAHHFEDVRVLDGDLYGAKGWAPLRNSSKRLLYRSDQEVDIESALMVSTLYGVRYFGHWVRDDLPRHLVAEDLALEPLAVHAQLTRFQAALLEHLKFDQRAVTSARIKKLVLVEDVGQNVYKAQRYARLKQLATQDIEVAQHPGIFILRGTGGEQRSLLNEDELAESMRALGLQVVDPQSMTPQRMVALSAGAETVVSVEGSQVMNAVLWMPAGARLVLLQPPARFNLTQTDAAECVGVRVSTHVCRPAPGASFVADVDRVRTLVTRRSSSTLVYP